MAPNLTNLALKYAPVWLQNIGISAYGYKWNKRRFGGIFENELKLFRNRESFTVQNWNDYQNKKLTEILLHSFNNIEYYNNKFKSYGLNEDKLRKISINDLNKLPFLEKNELRKYGTNTLLAVNKEKNGEFYSSSGSTGTPTKILYSTNFHKKVSAAYEARVRIWAGLTKDDSRGMIGGRRIVPEGIAKPPYYRYNFIEKQVYFSAYHISPKNIKNYLHGMLKYNLDYMVGYAMSNFFLASYIQTLGLRAPNLKAVITSSEKLTPQMREVFKEVYNCKTYDGWSGVENCALVSECENGNLHISPDVGVLEVLDENNKNVSSGESGEVVCTGFLNLDQPLIRYKIGDRMTLSNETCACGRNMPIIREIDGRIEDVVIGPDGRKMVRFHALYLGINKIRFGQVIQNTINNLTVKLVVEDLLTKDEENLIINRVISQLGNITVNLQYASESDFVFNGKFKSVISNLNK